MQTLWSGFGLPSTNLVWEDVLVPRSCPIVLPDMPGVVMRVTLPVTTHGVTLWTPQDQVWYAFDEDPGPIPAAQIGTAIPATAFAAGAVLQPGSAQLLVLPNDSMEHRIHLVSAAPNPLVILTALTEV